MSGTRRRTWAAFMQEALYDPDHGFFTSDPVGRHFTTAPHVSPVFAACIASLLASVERLCGPPVEFVELGSGDGTLARGIASSAPGLAARVAYTGIDVDPKARARATEAASGFGSTKSAAEIPVAGRVRGLVFANELFDNVPFHRLIGTDEGVRELFVEDTVDGSVLVAGEPDPEALAAASRVPEPGEERPAGTAARSMLRRVIETLSEGWVVALDYGFRRDEIARPVRGYRGHVLVDPLREPVGSCDVTGPVDIDALADEAAAAGGRVTVMSQADLLRAAGYDEFLSQLSSRQLAAQQGGEAGAALALQGVIDRASVLVDPDEMGSFWVLIVAVGTVPDLPFGQDRP